MSKFNRRELLKRSFVQWICFLGAGFIEPLMYEFFQQSAVDYYVAIQEKNPSKMRLKRNVKDAVIV
jgi:hypothetical protein